MIDIERAQAAIRAEGLSGWLLYDFQGLNPHAAQAMLPPGGHHTRRWFCLVPADGAPRWLVHAIEAASFRDAPGVTTTYARRTELVDGLRRLLDGAQQVAMEYSPMGGIPGIARVDAGTVELVRSLGVEVASSGDLIQRVLAPWPEGGLASHERAARTLVGLVERAWEAVADGLRADRPATECSVQRLLMEGMEAAGLVTSHPPIVAADAHAADPHFAPRPDDDAPLGPGRSIMLDIWAREPGPEGVYADMTFMAYTGARLSERAQQVWELIRDARDRAFALARERHARGEAVRGYELDRAARDAIEAAGLGERFIHRTGHSLGPDDHWVGANLDDYETRDDRRLIAGTGFTIEPGVYIPGEIGARTEIDVYWDADGPRATTPVQRELVRITADGVIGALGE